SKWPAPGGRAVVGLYSRIYDVSLADCLPSGKTATAWPSFDAFFTRRLRDGARDIDRDPRVIASPADGRIDSMVRIDEAGTFVVKGRPYAVDELVGDAREAQRFLAGAGVVVSLSPRDYFPVNAIETRHVPNLFCRNRRVAVEIDADGGLGRVTVIMVVAMIVGRIT